jgi:L-fucose isomerase
MADVSNMKVQDPTMRLKGGLPKIGIRPTIDGRLGGAREGLEAPTMGLAKAAAKLISGSLKHPSGHSVECVIADSTIGGVAEAAACAEKFAREGVAVTLTVTACWCYGSETMDMDPLTIKAVWGFNGTDRPGAVYLAAVLAAHSQKGLPAASMAATCRTSRIPRTSPPTSPRRYSASRARASRPLGCEGSPISP